MILTIVNYDTSDIHILKYDDNIDEKYGSPEEFIESLGYNLNNISYMFSDDLHTYIYDVNDDLNKKETARFIL